jgi:hypothetical protein
MMSRAMPTSDITRPLGKVPDTVSCSFDKFTLIEDDTEQPMYETRITVLADTKRGLACISIDALAGAGYRAHRQQGLAPSLAETHKRSIGVDRMNSRRVKPAPVRAAVMRQRL